MEESLQQKVFETLADVFGVLYAIPIRPLESSPPRRAMKTEDNYIEVRVDVSREGRYPTYFFFPRELARGVASNFMDIEGAQLDEEKMDQVVKEAVRMTIGGLLGKIDPDAKCLLCEPVVIRLDSFSPGWLAGAPGASGYETAFGCLWMDLGDIEKFC